MNKISARESALNALARREHSQQELRKKLLAKDYDEEEVATLLEVLKSERLQSDERFAESYVNYRITAGFGPLAIRHALRQRGVRDQLIHQALPEEQAFWQKALLRVWKKKYHGQSANNQRNYARQVRFLMQRGFGSEQIHRMLKSGVNERVE